MNSSGQSRIEINLRMTMHVFFILLLRGICFIYLCIYLFFINSRLVVSAQRAENFDGAKMTPSRVCRRNFNKSTGSWGLVGFFFCFSACSFFILRKSVRCVPTPAFCACVLRPEVSPVPQYRFLEVEKWVEFFCCHTLVLHAGSFRFGEIAWKFVFFFSVKFCYGQFKMSVLIKSAQAEKNRPKISTVGATPIKHLGMKILRVDLSDWFLSNSTSASVVFFPKTIHFVAEMGQLFF